MNWGLLAHRSQKKAHEVYEELTASKTFAMLGEILSWFLESSNLVLNHAVTWNKVNWKAIWHCKVCVHSYHCIISTLAELFTVSWSLVKTLQLVYAVWFAEPSWVKDCVLVGKLGRLPLVVWRNDSVGHGVSLTCLDLFPGGGKVLLTVVWLI